MNIAKIFIFAGALAICANAAAQQHYTSGNEHAIYCGTEETAIEATHADSEEMAELLKPGMTGPDCAVLKPGETFTLAVGNPTDDSVKHIVVPSSRLLGEAFIAGPIRPASPEPTKVSSNCSPGDVGPAGEIDRWVLSKDGTPKLKRFMVTSKCVNGQMRSFSKPLN